MTNIRIGIDLGGTKIEIAALTPDNHIILRQRVTTPQQDYGACIAAMVTLVEQTERKCEQHCSVGVATPGAISPTTGLIKNANSTWLNGQPLQQDLENALSRPVRLANDANCFVLSEWVDGAAKGYSNVFGVIIGTGTGGGLVVDGHLLQGLNAIAGEWGHNPLPWPQPTETPGPPCYCGKQGCIETYLSGPGLSRYYFEKSNENITVEEIVQRASDGESNAQVILQTYDDRMARALASVINIVDPDVIVLGGGLSNLSRLYEQVPKIWGQYVFSDNVATQLLAPLHGDSSGVRGAAWLW